MQEAGETPARERAWHSNKDSPLWLADQELDTALDLARRLLPRDGPVGAGRETVITRSPEHLTVVDQPHGDCSDPAGSAMIQLGVPSRITMPVSPRRSHLRFVHR